ncbi:MAG: helicase-associated domain-containing protein [Candidatus Sumerlaeota bacterium]
MKLKSVLRTMDTDGLRQMQEFWNLPAPSENGSGPLKQDEWVEFLYPRLQNGSHFQDAMERLEKEQQSLVYFLALHGGNMEEKELHKRAFPGHKSDMKALLAQLQTLGFVFSEKWTDVTGKPKVYGIPEPYLRLIELPHFWQGYLGNMLRQVPMGNLTRIASNGLGLKGVSNKRDCLMYEIRLALTDPERLREYIDSLPEDERELLFLLLQRRGVALYRDWLDMAHNRRPDINRNDAAESLLEKSGLVFAATDRADKYANMLRVPRDIYYIVTHHFIRDMRNIDDLDAIGHVDPAQEPKNVLDNGISILRDLVIFVGYVERHPVRRLGNGGVGKNDMKKILPRLSAGKTLKYAQFLAFYCIQKHCIVPEGDYWGASETFEPALLDSRNLFIDLYEFWFHSNAWNEEFAEGDTLHVDHRPSGLINIIDLRKLVMENLARIPFDKWIDGPRFIESLLAQIEVRIPHRGSHGYLEKDNRINYLAIESILCESLYWLGLVSLGLHEATDQKQLGARVQCNTRKNGSSQHRLDEHFNFNPRPFLSDEYQFHFQITGLGRSLLAAGPDATCKSLANNEDLVLPFRDDMCQFTVLPNLDVVAPPDLNLQVFYHLRQFAAISHIDVMSTLKITIESVRAGMESGLKGEEILKFLEDGCQSSLPETVRHLVNECSNRYGELTVGYAGGYIMVEDPALRENLLSNKSLKACIKDIKGEHMILLNRSADVQHVAEDLKSMGFMPSVDSENVYTSSEGRLRFALPPDDLGALVALLRFVNHVEEQMETAITEDLVLPLLNAMRPSNHAQMNISRHSEVLYKKFQKLFDAALEKKIDSVANKYRRQMREFLQQKSPNRERPTYTDANPATRSSDIRKMLRFAIEHEAQLHLVYQRSTGEEIEEIVTPESINGDKLFAFSDEQQSYCAYRIRRIVSARMD